MRCGVRRVVLEPPLLILDRVRNGWAAWGLRKLRRDYYGPCINIRRSNDNAAKDIGFDSNGNLDIGAILIFVGSNSAFVTKWYDQSINARDISQGTTTKQPRIVNAGVLDTANGLPTLVFNGSFYFISASFTTPPQPFTANIVFQRNDPTSLTNESLLGATSASKPAVITNGSNPSKIVTSETSSLTSTNTITASTLYALSSVLNNTSSVINFNKTKTSGSIGADSAATGFEIGSNLNGNNRLNGSISEFIITQNSIDSIINDQAHYYGISV